MPSSKFLVEMDCSCTGALPILSTFLDRLQRDQKSTPNIMPPLKEKGTVRSKKVWENE